MCNVNLLTTAGDGQARDKACAAVVGVGIGGGGRDKVRLLKIDRKEFSEVCFVDS